MLATPPFPSMIPSSLPHSSLSKIDTSTPPFLPSPLVLQPTYYILYLQGKLSLARSWHEFQTKGIAGSVINDRDVLALRAALCKHNGRGSWNGMGFFLYRLAEHYGKFTRKLAPNIAQILYLSTITGYMTDFSLATCRTKCVPFSFGSLISSWLGFGALTPKTSPPFLPSFLRPSHCHRCHFSVRKLPIFKPDRNANGGTASLGPHWDKLVSVMLSFHISST